MTDTVFQQRTRGFRLTAVLLGLVLMLPALPPASAQPTITIGFTAPNSADDPFFSNVVDAMQAAADDLGVKLNTNYGERTVSIYVKRQGMRLIESGELDYFITGFWPGGAKYHLPATESRGIPSLVINSPTTTEMGRAFTTPRGQLKHWLGQVTPDYSQGAYELADTLIDAAKGRNLAGDGKVHLIALSGSNDDVAASQRVQGLQSRVNQGDAVLHEIVLAGWSRQTAHKETTRLLNKHPETTVIWAASDAMAQGAAEAAELLGRHPGKDLLIGGFDWNESALKDIAAGRITASVGGHFLEGAWAVILLYDYHQGIDFADDPGLQFQSPTYAITRSNIDRFGDLLNTSDWNRIDFSRFSKALNKELKQYDFTIPAVQTAVSRVPNDATTARD